MPNNPDDSAVCVDFRRPGYLSRSHLDALRAIHQTFAADTAATLSAYLRAPVEARLGKLEQIQFSEFAEGITLPSSMATLGMPLHPEYSVLELGAPLLFPFLELLLGGKGGGQNLNRELTEIERGLVGGIVALIVRDLKEAWKAFAPLDFRVHSFESSSQLLNAIASPETVVAASIEMQVGERPGILRLAVPALLVKTLRQRLEEERPSHKPAASPEEEQRLLPLLQRAEVRVAVRMQGQTLSLRNIVAMKPGSILMFDYPVDRPLDVFVNDTNRFRAGLLNTGRKLAFCIEPPSLD